MAYHTEKGRRKGINQDSLLLIRALYRSGQQAVLAAVCDGMGGLKNGEMASAEVIYALARWFRSQFPVLTEKKEFEDALYDSWEELLQEEHRKIYHYGKQRGIRMGTTVTAMLLVQDDYYIAHVGDSRIYEIKQQAVQLTRDQVLSELDIGNGQPEQQTGEGEKVRQGKRKNVLLQGVGASKMLRPVYCSGQARTDAVYLLCSDGFRHQVSAQELLQAFAPEAMYTEEMMRERAEHITGTVMERGEKDNISVLLIRTMPEEQKLRYPDRCRREKGDDFQEDGNKREEKNFSIAQEVILVNSPSIG